MNYKKQLEILTAMQGQGFNVCSCGNCEGIILFDTETKEEETVICPHCEHTLGYSDCPDLYYEGMPELQKEEEETIPITYALIKNNVGWSRFCDVTGRNHYVINEWGDFPMNEIFYVKMSHAKELGFI